jgi:hypothetical protein
MRGDARTLRLADLFLCLSAGWSAHHHPSHLQHPPQKLNFVFEIGDAGSQSHRDAAFVGPEFIPVVATPPGDESRIATQQKNRFSAEERSGRVFHTINTPSKTEFRL